MTRNPAKLADMAALGCEVRAGDYDRPETLGPAMAGADKLLLISDTGVGARVAQHQAAVDAGKGGGRGPCGLHQFHRHRRSANPAEFATTISRPSA